MFFFEIFIIFNKKIKLGDCASENNNEKKVYYALII
jgi:hypothetical protein